MQVNECEPGDDTILVSIMVCLLMLAMQSKRCS